jgi:hypothetical protein
MERLTCLPVFGGSGGRFNHRPPTLTIRRASTRPRSRLGFAIPDEWRISVTAFPGQRRGDAMETLLHELVHLFLGASADTHRWHGRPFRETLKQAMLEAYGVDEVRVNGSLHGPYADALERRREDRSTATSKALHPGQLALIETPSPTVQPHASR